MRIIAVFRSVASRGALCTRSAGKSGVPCRWGSSPRPLPRGEEPLGWLLNRKGLAQPILLRALLCGEMTGS
jgi:hypothetical protein